MKKRVTSIFIIILFSISFFQMSSSAGEIKGEILEVTHKLVGYPADEITINVHVQDNENEWFADEYRVFIYSEDGTLLDKEPDTYWKNLDGTDFLFTISSDFDPTWDINDLGNSYRVVLEEQEEGFQDEIWKDTLSTPSTIVAVMNIPSNGEILNSICFDGKGSYPGGIFDYIYEYQWNFGDGISTDKLETSSILHEVENIYHTYWNAGTYSVTLTVWDNNGNSASDTFQITITNPYVNSGLDNEKQMLEQLAYNYSAVLYIDPNADHNSPCPVTRIIYNSALKYKTLGVDKTINDNPSIKDLQKYSGEYYYLDELDNNDKGDDNPTTYVHIRKDNNLFYIQYWFCYYDNDGINNHEGDWEMIQLSFDLNYNPLYATYSQHTGTEAWGFNWGEKRKWSNVEKYIEGNTLTTHPIVYVSSGTYLNNEANSHANYFYKGDNPWTDYTDSCSKKITFNDINELIILPNLEDDLDSNFGWLTFAGRWGAWIEFDPLDFILETISGPPGPLFCNFTNPDDSSEYRKWIDPYQFEDGRLEDGNHEESIENFKSLILTKIEISDYIEGSNKIDAYLFDSSDQPLGDMELNFYVDNEFKSSSLTDENGRASFDIEFIEKDQKEVNVVFEGTSTGILEIIYYAWCDEKATLTISDVGKTVPEIEWSKTFGGSSSTDVAFSVHQTTDGGYIIAGLTQSYGPVYSNNPEVKPFNAFIVKTDGKGDEIWNKTYGRSRSDDAKSILQTSDGGYIIAGSTLSYVTGQPAIWIIKTDAGGTETWNKMFEGVSDDYIGSIQQTNDGGYIIVGTLNTGGESNYDAWLIKTDADGNEIWSETFGGSDSDWAESIQQTNDGGYIIVGESYSYGSGSGDMWLIKTDADGNEIWSETFGGSDSDYAESIQQTNDGGYIIAGYTESYGAGEEDIWLIKVDSDGNKEWDKTFGGEKDDEAHSVQQTNDGGYIIGGHSYGFGGKNIWLIKTDADGNEIWSETFGGTGFASCYSVQQTTDKGYIIAGSTTGYSLPDFLLMKIKLSPVSPSDQSPENEGSTPGFELIFVVISLVSVLLWRRRGIPL